MIIDCAFDESLAEQLSKYLTEHGFEIQKEETIIKSNDPRLTQEELELFLKRTGKIKDLQLIQSDPDVVIIAAKVMIEHFGLARCNVCGFVAFKEELMAHERVHMGYLL